MQPLEFWKRIAAEDFKAPTSPAPLELIPELLELLGSPDPVLRDEIAYRALAFWIMRGVFDDQTKRDLIPMLEAKLTFKIGESGTDSVFSRSFACLIFAALIGTNNEKSFLEPGEVEHVLELALSYLEREQDLRGFIPGQGWAHAVAHCADWLDEHANTPDISAANLERILEALANKTEIETIYLFDEEDRLAYAASRVIARGKLEPERIEAWAKALASRVSATDEQKSNGVRRHNAKGFLRSTYLYLEKLEDGGAYLEPMRRGFEAVD
jgi:Protein of unknown function (DUF2785)